MLPLLHTKVCIPPPRRQLVTRPHLLERVKKGMQRALTLVVAPAGCGKTTLLAEWAQDAAMPATWLSLEPADRDPNRFLAYMIHALQKAAPDIGQTSLSLLHSGQDFTAETILYGLINDLVEMPGDLALVLDDFHTIEGSEAENTVQFLLQHRPPRLHMALASRSMPSFSLARLRARDQVVEIGAPDLRFSMTEVNTFLEGMGIHLGAEEARHLDRFTEGWAVGLQLAALALARQTLPLDLPAGRAEIFDYLAEEVLRHEAPHVQTFLLRTALFDRFNLALCEVLLADQPSPAATLAHVEQANLFLVPLDSSGLWFRYHALFSDFLRQRFETNNPGQIPRLYQTASLWCEDNGMLEDAIHYATHAGEHERAARLIENHYRELLQRGEQTALMHWLSGMPSSLVEGRPGLLLASGWASVIALEGAQAEHCASLAESLLPSGKEWAPQHLEAKALRTLARIFHAQASPIEEISSDFIRFSEQDDFLHAVLHLILGMNFTLNEETRKAVDAFKETIQLKERLNNPLLTIVAWREMGEVYQLRGELGLAERAFQESIVYTQDSLGKHTFLQGMPLVSYAELLREMNRFAEARRQGEQGIEYCLQWQPTASIDGMITLARCDAAEGNWEKAFARLEEARSITEKTDSFLDDIFLAIHRIRLHLLHGDLHQARRLAERYQPREYFKDRAHFLQEMSTLALLRLRILESADDPAASTRLAEEAAALLPGMEHSESASPWIEAQILRAYALHAARMHTDACSVLNLALQRAAQCGYLRLLADEGERLLHILDQYRSRLVVDHSYLEILLPLLGAGARPQSPPGLDELPPFTRREMDILTLMAAGRSNQEIAAELVLALNTVKKHVANILGKLGVVNRTQPVTLARQRGWI